MGRLGSHPHIVTVFDLGDHEGQPYMVTELMGGGDVERVIRGIMVKPDNPQTIFVTIGDTTPGRNGTVMRSTDTGKTWQNLSLPVQPNKAMWVVNAQPFNPQVIFAGSRYGYLYRSDDGGESWSKLWREFSEILPLASPLQYQLPVTPEFAGPARDVGSAVVRGVGDTGQVAEKTGGELSGQFLFAVGGTAKGRYACLHSVAGLTVIRGR